VTAYDSHTVLVPRLRRRVCCQECVQARRSRGQRIAFHRAKLAAIKAGATGPNTGLTREAILRRDALATAARAADTAASYYTLEGVSLLLGLVPAILVVIGVIALCVWMAL
jgi:hypothetical protein